ncbi:MAG: hypothetical protein ACE5GJ_11990 [Gemmatimonadota bacterium]
MPQRSRLGRIGVVVFLLIHFGSIAYDLLPESPSSVADLPGPLGASVLFLSRQYQRLLRPMAEAYLNATGTRQNWELFAPYPIAWNVDVDAVYFRKDMGRHAVRLRGPGEVPLPHWLDRRAWRVLFSVGYEGVGEAYRPFLMRFLCIHPPEDAPHPEEIAGIQLVAWWTPVIPPWRTGDPTPYRQPLGGAACRQEEMASP